MIPFDFDYYRPDTVGEAAEIYSRLDSQGKEPLYYGGGSEIISLARVNNIRTKAVIDLKAIPECNILEFREDRLLIGSSVTLSGNGIKRISVAFKNSGQDSGPYNAVQNYTGWEYLRDDNLQGSCSAPSTLRLRRAHR